MTHATAPMVLHLTGSADLVSSARMPEVMIRLTQFAAGDDRQPLALDETPVDRRWPPAAFGWRAEGRMPERRPGDRPALAGSSAIIRQSWCSASIVSSTAVSRQPTPLVRAGAASTILSSRPVTQGSRSRGRSSLPPRQIAGGQGGRRRHARRSLDNGSGLIPAHEGTTSSLREYPERPARRCSTGVSGCATRYRPQDATAARDRAVACAQKEG